METINIYGIPGVREPVASFLHLLAVPVFFVLGYILIRRGRGSGLQVASLAVFSFAAVFLLAMSGIYHLLPIGTGRMVMKQLDVSAVFVMIAATGTPMHAILFRGTGRWLPLLFAWSFAAVGITLRIVFWGSLPPGAGSAIFLLMGWCGAFAFFSLWRRYGYTFVEPLLWGGIAYTVGVLMLTSRWPEPLPGVIGSHELWHVAVLCGLGLHWRFTLQFAAGRPETVAAQTGDFSPSVALPAE